MDKVKLGQDPALPVVIQDGDDFYLGMSKRLYIASMAMQGWISCQHARFTGDPESIARQSFEYADELLRQENL